MNSRREEMKEATWPGGGGSKLRSRVNTHHIQFRLPERKWEEGKRRRRWIVFLFLCVKRSGISLACSRKRSECLVYEDGIDWDGCNARIPLRISPSFILIPSPSSLQLSKIDGTIKGTLCKLLRVKFHSKSGATALNHLKSSDFLFSMNSSILKRVVWTFPLETKKLTIHILGLNRTRSLL